MSRHRPARIVIDEAVLHDRSGRRTPALDLQIAGRTLYFRVKPWRHGEIEAEQRIRSHERWLLPDLQIAVHRFTMFEDPLPYDWYVDLDRITVDSNVWTVEDQLLDVVIYEGLRYEVEDADELAGALEDGGISLVEAAGALRSLHAVTSILARNGCSCVALLAQYAPDLPR